MTHLCLPTRSLLDDICMFTGTFLFFQCSKDEIAPVIHNSNALVNVFDHDQYCVGRDHHRKGTLFAASCLSTKWFHITVWWHDHIYENKSAIKVDATTTKHYCWMKIAVWARLFFFSFTYLTSRGSNTLTRYHPYPPSLRLKEQGSRFFLECQYTRLCVITGKNFSFRLM